MRLVVAVINSFHFDLSKAHVELKRIYPDDSDGKDNNNAADDLKKSDETVTQKDNKLEEGEQKGGNQNEGDDNDDDDDGDGGSGSELDGDDDETLEKELDKTSEVDEGIDERSGNDYTVCLTKAAASRVVHAIRTALLPQLQNTIYMRSESEKLHKVNKKMAGTEQDEEDILRVPVSMM